MAHSTGEARYREAFARGVDYLLAAQYENVGWPQFFPLREGYHSHITYKNGARVGVLRLLRDAAGGRPPYSFVDEQRRARAAAAVAHGGRENAIFLKPEKARAARCPRRVRRLSRSPAAERASSSPAGGRASLRT